MACTYMAAQVVKRKIGKLIRPNVSSKDMLLTLV
jgi:hypothetical protein